MPEVHLVDQLGAGGRSFVCGGEALGVAQWPGTRDSIVAATTFQAIPRNTVRINVWLFVIGSHVVIKKYLMNFMRYGCNVFSYAVPMCAAFSISLLLHSLQVFYAQTSGAPWRGSLCTAVSSFSTWNAFLRVLNFSEIGIAFLQYITCELCGLLLWDGSVELSPQSTRVFKCIAKQGKIDACKSCSWLWRFRIGTKLQQDKTLKQLNINWVLERWTVTLDNIDKL